MIVYRRPSRLTYAFRWRNVWVSLWIGIYATSDQFRWTRPFDFGRQVLHLNSSLEPPGSPRFLGSASETLIVQHGHWLSVQATPLIFPILHFISSLRGNTLTG